MTKRPTGGPTTRGGTAAPDDGSSLRRCIVSREPQTKDGLIRFVVAPDGVLTPDLAEVLPGRGLWVTASREAIETACAKKLFGRAARRAVKVPDDLLERLEHMLAERCIALLGLLNRAGELSAGMMRVREWLRADKAAILMTAAESDGRDAAELRRLARGVQTVDVLKGVELGRAVGRDLIVHMAAAPGRLAQSLIRETGRLAGLRDGGVR
ncbi:MAG: RNA-binding protein [Alphaproteobacteria bacterium]|nr:RNA-binding protein [Alphaproteobacteria bacterium]